jgi:hypothetical protein
VRDPADVLAALEREERAGVAHYRAGQHVAWVEPQEPNAAVLLYVDAMGWAVIMGCERQCDWEAVVVLGRVSATGVAQGERELPADFRLSDAARRALANPEAL